MLILCPERPGAGAGGKSTSTSSLHPDHRDCNRMMYGDRTRVFPSVGTGIRNGFISRTSYLPSFIVWIIRSAESARPTKRSAPASRPAAATDPSLVSNISSSSLGSPTMLRAISASRGLVINACGLSLQRVSGVRESAGALRQAVNLPSSASFYQCQKKYHLASWTQPLFAALPYSSHNLL